MYFTSIQTLTVWGTEPVRASRSSSLTVSRRLRPLDQSQLMITTGRRMRSFRKRIVPWEGYSWTWIIFSVLVSFVFPSCLSVSLAVVQSGCLLLLLLFWALLTSYLRLTCVCYSQLHRDTENWNVAVSQQTLKDEITGDSFGEIWWERTFLWDFIACFVFYVPSRSHRTFFWNQISCLWSSLFHSCGFCQVVCVCACVCHVLWGGLSSYSPPLYLNMRPPEGKCPLTSHGNIESLYECKWTLC